MLPAEIGREPLGGHQAGNPPARVIVPFHEFPAVSARSAHGDVSRVGEPVPAAALQIDLHVGPDVGVEREVLGRVHRKKYDRGRRLPQREVEHALEREAFSLASGKPAGWHRYPPAPVAGLLAVDHVPADPHQFRKENGNPEKGHDGHGGQAPVFERSRFHFLDSIAAPGGAARVAGAGGILKAMGWQGIMRSLKPRTRGLGHLGLACPRSRRAAGPALAAVLDWEGSRIRA